MSITSFIAKRLCHTISTFFGFRMSIVLDDVKGNILGNCLLQIKSTFEKRHFQLTDVWTTVIIAQKSQLYINYVKANCPVDPIDLSHIRKLVKITDDSSQPKTLLRFVICSAGCMSKKEEMKYFMDKFDPNLQIEKRSVPLYPPKTKEESLEWSKKYWPIMWRGNPTLRTLSTLEINYGNVQKRLIEAVELSKANPNQLPICTMIVDPLTDNVLTVSTDKRFNSSPLNHSIMICISDMAKKEVERRSSGIENESRNYLCHNLHVYTTHEPCAMCAMALVHSRISRLIYIKSSPKTGALEPSSGAGYGIHNNKMLNWDFEVFKWIDGELEVCNVPETLNV